MGTANQSRQIIRGMSWARRNGSCGILGLALFVAAMGQLRCQPTFEWVVQIPGEMNTSGNGSTIAIDAAGNSYVSAQFRGTVRFGTIMLTNPNPSFYEMFIAKFDRSGVVQWFRQISGDNNENSGAVAVTSSGQCYFTGGTQSRTAVFGNGITLPGSIWEVV